tara:strand:+ start:27725 stop:28297 length:573 start_codon:yes stop_codon:yes gene_type:complete
MKVLVVVTICCLLSVPAFAQESETSNRRGVFLGFAAGVANSNLKFPAETQNNTNLALNWKIGYLFNSKLAVLLNGAVSIYEYDLSGRSRSRDFGGVFASVQYFLSPKISVLGGVGIGTDAPVFYDVEGEEPGETDYHLGIGLVSSVGYELHRYKKYSFGIQARFNYSRVKLPIGETSGFTSALLLGVDYY